MTEKFFIHNKAQSRYERHVGQAIALADYKQVEHMVYITHVETPPELEGQGIASQLMKQILEDIAQHQRKVVPICSFAKAYIQKHPQWQPLLHCD